VSTTALKLAKEVHIMRVSSPISDGNALEYSRNLKKFFKTPRILKVGDIFGVKAQKGKQVIINNNSNSDISKS
jgi:hypothetical protein